MQPVDWSAWLPRTPDAIGVVAAENVELMSRIAALQDEPPACPAPVMLCHNPRDVSDELTRFSSPLFVQFLQYMPQSAYTFDSMVVYQNFYGMFLGQTATAGYFVLPVVEGVWQLTHIWQTGSNSHPLDNDAVLQEYMHRLQQFQGLAPFQPGNLIRNPLATIVEYLGRTSSKRIRR
jgi:hypothetical protein